MVRLSIKPNSTLCATFPVSSFRIVTRATAYIHWSWSIRTCVYYLRLWCYRRKQIRIEVARVLVGLWWTIRWSSGQLETAWNQREPGRWQFDEQNVFPCLVSIESRRQHFLEQAGLFLRRHNLDGLDLNWFYPYYSWTTLCERNRHDDKANFGKLITELADAFKPSALLLSAVVTIFAGNIERSYDVAVLSQHLDWITVRTTEYYGLWRNRTGNRRVSGLTFYERLIFRSFVPISRLYGSALQTAMCNRAQTQRCKCCDIG